MRAENERTERQEKMLEHLNTTHMLCIVILIASFTLNKDMFNMSNNIYPIINIRLFLLISLVGFGVVLLYARNSRVQKKSKFFSWINLTYITFPLLVAVIVIFTLKNNSFSSKTILILPVLVTASVMGKRAGLVMATVCASILVFYQIVTGVEKSLVKALESELIIISIMYVVGWFVGVVTNLEAQNREQLKTSLLSLKEEIAVRERVEVQLRKLSSAVEQSPSIVVITDAGGNIEYVNNKFTQITGYSIEEITGKDMRDLYGQSYGKYAQMWEAVNSGGEWRGEFYNKKKNGEFYWEDVSVLPFRDTADAVTHFLKVGEDITERKQVGEEMVRLDRLNLVGEMAAGIGHEVRNPMTTVRGFLQLLGRKKDCAQHKEFFELMIEELDRANSIITEFLSLAKNKAVEKRVMNLNQIVKTLSPLIEAEALKTDNPYKVELGNISDLLLDEKEIRQIILNLVRNGLEAMSSGGDLTIRTYADGDEVVLSVRDQGKGIEPDVLERIGTPFFTTKDNGTGLGLAVCYSIAARHNATIKVEAGPVGTTFYVRFKRING